MFEHSQHTIPEDVRAMLAKATPHQVARLLRDIMHQPAPQSREGAKYDA